MIEKYLSIKQKKLGRNRQFLYLCCETSNVFWQHVLPLNLLNCVNSNPVTNVTQAKNKHHQLKKNIQETKIHAIRCFPAESFAVHIGDHFGVRDHLRSNLGIISGLGIICGRGSFVALYKSQHTIDITLWLFLGYLDICFI